MKFGREKYVMLVMKSDKWHLTDGRELPDQDKIRTLGEKETYKYSGILEAGSMKQVGMRQNMRKWFLRVTRKLPDAKSL